MTVYYRLIQNTTTVDLIGGTAKMSLDGYQQYVDGNRVTEVFTIVVESTTRALVRAALNDVFEMLEAAVRWHDGLDQYPVFLRFYTDGETAKQALVYGYELVPVVFRGISHQLETGNGKYTTWNLAITRDREWEAIADASGGTVAGLTTTGAINMIVYSTLAGGHVPGRITKLVITNPDDDYNRFWIGFHKLRTGSATVLHPAVNLGTAYTGTDTTITATGAVDYGNNTAITTFSSNADWLARAYGSLPNDFETDPSALHYVGRWLVLLRARVSAATEVMVRLSVSAGDPYLFGVQPTLMHQGPPVVVHQSLDHLYELGEIQLPLTGWNQSTLNESLAGLRLNLEARRISGTGSLTADCFFLIPAEHLVVLNEIEITTGKKVVITTDERNRVQAFRYDDSGGTYETVEAIAAVTENYWRLPTQGGVLIAAFESSTGHVLADSIDVTLSYRHRWLGYRE